MDQPITYLFVPADRPDRFARAFASGSDRVVLDLEDAVRSDEKHNARQAVRAASIDWTKTVIRVNAADTDAHSEDLETLSVVPAGAILLTKAERSKDINAVLSAAGTETEVIPQIETAVGLENIDDLLAAPGVRRVALGHLDYALDIGAEPVREALSLARQTIVLRSRIARKERPIASVTPELASHAIVQDSRYDKALGFGGKLLIHPDQVAPCRAAFAPSEQELRWAEKVMAAVANSPGGASRVDGRMVDKPVLDAARNILAQAGH